MTECPPKPWHDPHYLRVAYWGRGQTADAIADACGVSHNTILYWMEKHGIVRREKNARRTLSSGELITDLQRVADLVDGIPSTTDYGRHGAYTATTVINHFGTWTDALREAGVYDHD